MHRSVIDECSQLGGMLMYEPSFPIDGGEMVRQLPPLRVQRILSPFTGKVAA